MAPRSKKTEEQPRPEIPDHTNLTAAFSKKSNFKRATFWIVGDTPLITHSWSEGGRKGVLGKQLKATTSGKAPRDPNADYMGSLYEMREGVYGFPVTGVKKCFLSAAHKDKGIAKTDVRSALFLEAEMVRVQPAIAGAICDVPLVRIWSDPPEMREDTVKIGAMTKTATLAFRGQFRYWAIRIEARFNPDVLTPEALAFIISESGIACGLGEWRNERNGMFGAFHLARSAEEEAQWNAFSQGKGPLPMPQLTDHQMKIAAE